MTRNLSFAVFLVLVGTLAHGSRSVAQDEQAKDDGATVRGQLTMDDGSPIKLVWADFPLSIVEQLPLRQPKLPEDWSAMGFEARQAWMSQFRDSDEGKRLIAENQAILQRRSTIKIDVEPDGRFSVYDVPNAKYVLQGEMETKVDGKTYSAQVYGEFEVGEAGEVDLAKMQVDVLRVLEAGEEAPVIVATGLAAEQVNLAKTRGKHVVLVFAIVDSDAFKAVAANLAQSLTKLGEADIDVFAVSLDADKSDVQKIFSEYELQWDCALLGGWNMNVLNQYGVRSVPSIWMLDADGRIAATGNQVALLLGQHRVPLSRLVSDLAAGQLKSRLEVLKAEEGSDR